MAARCLRRRADGFIAGERSRATPRPPADVRVGPPAATLASPGLLALSAPRPSWRRPRSRRRAAP
jgi:hypothetical protein